MTDLSGELPRDELAIKRLRKEVNEMYFEDGAWEADYAQMPEHWKYSPSRFEGRPRRPVGEQDRKPWRFWEFPERG